MARIATPLLTADTLAALCAARTRGDASWAGSLDLDRSVEHTALDANGFVWRGALWPWPAADARFKERTVYALLDGDWRAVQRFGGSLIKLVPTGWGPPTFEIFGPGHQIT